METSPAYNKTPEILTPSTLFTIMQGFPVVETNVANPNPKIIVFGRVTCMLS